MNEDYYSDDIFVSLHIDLQCFTRERERERERESNLCQQKTHLKCY